MLKVCCVLSLLIVCSLQLDEYELSLPVYLRGIGWKEVEDTGRQDLRLFKSVVPVHYDIDLHVNVRGYNGATRSEFIGCVSIQLNIREEVNGIELHAMRIDLINATLRSRYDQSSIFTTHFARDINRETITVFKGTKIGKKEAELQICYNGTADSRFGGLMESWAKEDASVSLIANTAEPTGARHWFPCFDQPDMKATFQLKVDHPAKLHVYSNTPIEWVASDMLIRSHTLFKRTPRFPPYLIGLAVNDHKVYEDEYNGHKIRVMGPFASIALDNAKKVLAKVWNHSMFEGVPFVVEKTDIIVVEDMMSAFELPGLITFSPEEALNEEVMMHEIAHMYFGNLVTISSFNEVWIKEGMASLLEEMSPMDHATLYYLESLHDLPLQPQSNLLNSITTTKYFHYPSHPYQKGVQVMRAIRRMHPQAFDQGCRKYLLRNAYGNGDAESFISSIADLTPYPRETQEIFRSIALKPGRPLLIVNRNRTTVTIRQTRFQTTYFDPSLRDVKMRYTVPVFFTVNNVSYHRVFRSEDEYLSLPVEAEDEFELDSSYFLLWRVYYNYTVHQKETFMDSIKTALEIGLISFDEVISRVENHLHLLNKTDLKELVKMGERMTRTKYSLTKEDRNILKDNFFNRICPHRNWTAAYARYKMSVIKSIPDLQNLLCGLNNTAEFKRLLHRVLEESDNVIRPDDMRLLAHIMVLADPYATVQFLFDSFEDGSYRSFPISAPLFSFYAFTRVILSEDHLEQLRRIIRKDKYLSASMADKFAQAFERDYIRVNRPKWYNVTIEHFRHSFKSIEDLMKN